MEKFKNFFYNKNDIIVAILILTIAVFVIAFRIKSLMDYPKTLSEDKYTTTTKTEQINQKNNTTQAKSTVNCHLIDMRCFVHYK